MNGGGGRGIRYIILENTNQIMCKRKLDTINISIYSGCPEIVLYK